ncbi:MAG TPA: hypothetical protein VMV50_00565 [Candidatus Paceibacterota bacterium]|nr:hypothetical protein [Candidatus Paceibacterota bacterium]
MKKQIRIVGTLALAVMLGGAPLAAFAQAGVNVGVGAAVRVNTQEQQQQQQGAGAYASATVQVRTQEENQEQGQTQERAGEGEAGNATSTAAHERILERLQERIQLQLESTTTPAYTFAQLQQSIRTREQQLEQEASSTATSTRGIIKNANQVRLAVHAFLAAKDLLGGIGPEVSQIAQQVNQSLATTTNAEAEIQARGFWTALFFGGDTNAASIISQEVARNQTRIQTLTQLMNQASTTADVKATLQVQITAMQQEQTRLQALASQQQGQWGIFSWRF